MGGAEVRGRCIIVLYETLVYSDMNSTSEESIWLR